MIEILHYEQTIKNKLIGYVDLKITIQKPTTIILRKLAHLSNDGKKWINFPSFPRQNDDGSQRYFRYAEFNETNLNTKFQELVMQAVTKYLEENKIIIEKKIEEEFIDYGNPPF